MSSVLTPPDPARVHDLIAANVCRVIGQLASRPCKVHQGNLLIKVEATGLCTEPDVVVACEGRRFADGCGDTLLNPILLVEVLSESTAEFDCGIKAAHYRCLASLQEFLLVDPNVAAVEHFVREDAKTWRITSVDGLDAVLNLKSIGCRLPLREAYATLKLHPEAKLYLRLHFKPEPQRHPN